MTHVSQVYLEYYNKDNLKTLREQVIEEERPARVNDTYKT